MTKKSTEVELCGSIHENLLETRHCFRVGNSYSSISKTNSILDKKQSTVSHYYGKQTGVSYAFCTADGGNCFCSGSHCNVAVGVNIIHPDERTRLYACRSLMMRQWRLLNTLVCESQPYSRRSHWLRTAHLKPTEMEDGSLKGEISCTHLGVLSDNPFYHFTQRRMDCVYTSNPKGKR
jgi:hypothetical protein